MKYNVNTYNGPSFSLENRLARVLWDVVYLIFFRYSPKPFHFWRSFILRIFGAKVGRGAHIYPKVRIWAPWNLEIGNEVGVANEVDLYCQEKIVLEDRAIVSQRSYLCCGTHDFTKVGNPLYAKPIVIKANAWVAAEVFIGPGVVIGEGAVVGARSAVFKNVEPWTVVGGNPTKKIKERILQD